MPSSQAQRIGAIAEARFAVECLERNFEPHLPATPMPWDFIVTCPAGILKIQVKSTAVKRPGEFYNIITSTGHSTKETMSRDVNVVACYASPIDTWWIIPREIITGKTLKLYDEPSTRSRYKKYQNNWSPFYE